MRRYSEVTGSGVSWLGDVPSHWVTRPLFAEFEEKLNRNRALEESNVLSLSYGRIVEKNVADNFGLLPESFETYQIVEAGDIILRLTDLQNDHTSLRTGLVPCRGIITSAYTNLRTKGGLLPEYAAYLLHACDLSKEFYSLGGGVRQSIDYSDLKHLPLLRPPLPEQKAIAAFLDQRLAGSRQLSDKLEEMMSLLQESKRAFASRAVTIGLNGAAKMRPTGIPWHPLVPAHWKSTRISSCYKRVKETGFPNELLLSVYREHGIVPRNSRDDNHNVASEDLSAYQLVSPSDLVLNKMKAWQGSVSISELRGIVSPAYFVARPIVSGLEPRFIHHMLRCDTFVHEYRCYSTGVRPGQWDLDWDRFKTMPLFLPPVQERVEISTRIDAEAKRIDGIISKQEGMISLLAEQRASLVLQAVTGKIDVRPQ